jgi:hypothetical protein
MGQQIGGRLLIATHLGQSNYLANQNQGVENKCYLNIVNKSSK